MLKNALGDNSVSHHGFMDNRNTHKKAEKTPKMKPGLGSIPHLSLMKIDELRSFASSDGSITTGNVEI